MRHSNNVLWILWIISISLPLAGSIEWKTNPTPTADTDRQTADAQYHTGTDDLFYYGTNRWATLFRFDDFFPEADSVLFIPEEVVLWFTVMDDNPGSFTVRLYENTNEINPVPTGLPLVENTAELTQSGWVTLPLAPGGTGWSWLWLEVEYSAPMNGNRYISASRGDGTHSWWWDPEYTNQGGYRNMHETGYDAEFLFGLNGTFTFPGDSFTDIELVDVGYAGMLSPSLPVTWQARVRNNGTAAFSDGSLTMQFAFPEDCPAGLDQLVLEGLSLQPHETQVFDVATSTLPGVAAQVQASATVALEDSTEFVYNNSLTKTWTITGATDRPLLIENLVHTDQALPLWNDQQEMTLEDSHLILNYFPEPDDSMYTIESGERFNFYGFSGVPGTVVHGNRRIEGWIPDIYPQRLQTAIDTSLSSMNWVSLDGFTAVKEQNGDTHVTLEMTNPDSWVFSTWSRDCLFFACLAEKNVSAGTDSIPGFVFLNMLTDATGETVTSLDHGETDSFTFNFNLLALQAHHGMGLDVIEHLSVLWWVQHEDTGLVAGVGEIPLSEIEAQAVMPIHLSEIGIPVTETDLPLDYIEIYNSATNNALIEGWQIQRISDRGDTLTIFEFAEDTQIQGGGFLIAARDRKEFIDYYGASVDTLIVLESVAADSLIITDGVSWRLTDAAGTVIEQTSDQLEWTLGLYQRQDYLLPPDLDTNWFYTETGTPGQPNAVNPAFSIRLSEIGEPSDSHGGDAASYIEIYNTASSQADISGFSIVCTDPAGEEHTFVFPNGTSIQSGQFLLAVRDADAFFESYPDEVDPHLVVYNAGSDPEPVMIGDGYRFSLFDASGELIEQTSPYKAWGGKVYERNDYDTDASDRLNWYLTYNTGNPGTPGQDNSTADGALQRVAIYDIQYVDNPAVSDLTPFLGQSLEVSGIITAIFPSFYFIQTNASDPRWQGVCVDGECEWLPGDQVSLDVVATEAADRTILLEATPTGSVPVDVGIPRTYTVSSGTAGSDEGYEGCLVRIQNSVVTEVGLENDEFIVDDGSGPCRVGRLSGYLLTPSVGDSLQWVVGILDEQEDIRRIEPRSESDIIPSRLQNTPTRLLGNSPNPFNPVTVFRFSLASEQRVRMEVYNIRGQRVRVVTDEKFHPGFHEVVWDGTDDRGHAVASGIYLARFRSGNTVTCQKCMLLK